MDSTHRRIYLGHRVGDVTDLYENFGEELERLRALLREKLVD